MPLAPTGRNDCRATILPSWETFFWHMGERGISGLNTNIDNLQYKLMESLDGFARPDDLIADDKLVRAPRSRPLSYAFAPSRSSTFLGLV